MQDLIFSRKKKNYPFKKKMQTLIFSRKKKNKDPFESLIYINDPNTCIYCGSLSKFYFKETNELLKKLIEIITKQIKTWA